MVPNTHILLHGHPVLLQDGGKACCLLSHLFLLSMKTYLYKKKCLWRGSLPLDTTKWE